MSIFMFMSLFAFEVIKKTSVLIYTRHTKVSSPGVSRGEGYLMVLLKSNLKRSSLLSIFPLSISICAESFNIKPDFPCVPA